MVLLFTFSTEISNVQCHINQIAYFHTFFGKHHRATALFIIIELHLRQLFSQLFSPHIHRFITA